MDHSSRLLLEPDYSFPLEWHECDCPLCGSDEWSAVIEAPDHSRQDGLRFLVVQCHHCGLCFTNPRPSPEAMAQFYPEEYKPHRPAHDEDIDQELDRGLGLQESAAALTPARKQPGRSARPARERWWHRFLPRQRGKAWRKALTPHGQGRLLDFGCGNGAYLLRMQRLGWKVTGVDLSAPTIERIHRQFGLNVFQGSLPHPLLQDGAFDTITMWQSLEHVHQPLEVLLAAHRLLAPGGKIVVAAHNIDSLPFRWFGAAWFALDLPRHLTHFAPSTLRLMLQRAGFEAGPAYMIRHSSWLRHSAQLARRALGRPSRWLTLLRTRVGSNLASWYCYLTRMSDSMIVTGVKA